MSLKRICQTNVLQIVIITFCTLLDIIELSPIAKHDTSLTERYTDLSNKSTFFHQVFSQRFSCRFALHFSLIRLYTKDSSVSNEAVAIIYTSRSRVLIGTSLFKRGILLPIYLVISHLLIYVLRFVKQFRLFCRTNPVASSSKT